MKLPGSKTPVEAAAYLKCSRTTLFKLIKSGQLKAVNVGMSSRPRWAIADEELERFVRAKLGAVTGPGVEKERRIVKVPVYIRADGTNGPAHYAFMAKMKMKKRVD